MLGLSAMVRKTATPRRTGLATKLAEASWAEADKALAQAWADFAEFAAAAKGRTQLIALVDQSLARAARQRGMARIGAAGDTGPYEPDLHELIFPRARSPALIQIVAPGVSRGDKVLLKARVKPARSTP